MRRKKNIITNNGEIYKKLNMLNFSREVVLKNVKDVQIQKIINNINSDLKVLDMEKIGDYFVIKRINPINFNIYRKKR